MMTKLFLILLIFIFGLLVGSFLNSVIYRIKNNKKIVFDRSKCPHCGHILNWFDLLPLLSFILLRGKCRYCQKSISWQYPLVELFTALIFILPLVFPNNFLPSDIFFAGFWQILCYYFLLSAVLIVIFVFDLKYYFVPDKVLFLGILISVLFNVLIFRELLISKILGALLFSSFFLFQYLISKGKWIGFGDVKLGALLGFVLGWKLSLVNLFLSYLIGAIISIGLIAVQKKTLKSEIPFGPILIIGFLVSLLWGNEIILWYFNLFS
ncbi:prepilin peptidase [bacterium]|nr:prepilin peptidase [bacterium]